DYYGVTLPVSDVHHKKSILLKLNENGGEKERYELNVTKNGITIAGDNPASVLMGIQTLRQLLPVAKNSKDLTIPQLFIADSAAYEWRGIMLDVARHFLTKEEVMKMLDMMALYKFNKFHWHLSDDQGWRVEIKQYPLLTEASGWRTFNNHDQWCFDAAERDQNNDMLLPESKLRIRNGEQEYGGFYTQDDIREVVAYAAKRGIEVIPEIDMPGHFTAALNPYPENSCFGEPGWGKQFSAPLCPGKDHVLEFCQNVYREIFELFPSQYVHLGADEVEKDNWIKCPDCQKRITDNNLEDEKDLQAWFVGEMNTFFEENNKKMIGWDEITYGNLSKNATVMWWRSWMKDAVDKSTTNGNEVIMAPNSHCYFDYKQDHKTLQNLFEFEPVPQDISTEQRKLIKGLQANLWAESVASFQRAEYMVFPRILILSELAWRNDTSRRWEEFYPKLVNEFTRLDGYQINYRPLDLPDVHFTNTFVGETMVTWNYPLPQIELRYTTDGTTPDRNAELYTEPFQITETTNFIIRYFRPDGSAADIFRTSYRKESYQPGEALAKLPSVHLDWHEAVVRKCLDMDTLPVKKSYELSTISIPDEVSQTRALCYTGFFDFPEDDIYTFHLNSDDGSQLYINDEIVVDNDGPHGSVTLSGQKALGKGAHPFKLYYFDMNNGGCLHLKIVDQKGKVVFETKKM
ncbi:family 20 glycosylhydrolase, partial [Bacteroidales bacterium OttesenSCG-928-B11]|nr:family 20 glycosylhydrolase [Bacteroidales bacterium OttesenSCG-928-B11]